MLAVSYGPEPVGDADPRLRGWQERLASRADEAATVLAAVPGVRGVMLGGSFGRGEHWPLSDLDFAVVCSGRSVEDTAREVDARAYQLSEMWGSSGIYTAVDAGRLTYDADEVRAAAGDSGADRLGDDRWLHGIDKMYGGVARHDADGLAQVFLEWSARQRFTPAVVHRRIEIWLTQAQRAIAEAERVLTTGDWLDAWVSIRRAGSMLAEVATERWGQRAGSLGRYWTRFEARARRAGDPELAGRIVAAVRAEPHFFAAVVDSAPEWLHDRIALSYAARRLVDEPVTPEQNIRDNLLAYAVLYRRRFPAARPAWLGAPPDADPGESIRTLTALHHDLR